MSAGLDFSQYRKIASDGKTTVLRHPTGKDIKIAHSSLSKDLKAQIESLPVHLAEGGDPKDVDPESPEKVTASYAPPYRNQPAKAPVEQAPPQEAPQAPSPKQQQNMATAPDPNPPQQNPQMVAQGLNRDHQLFEQELALGKITPETFSSLYGKKDTLGKIGTLFGLMISGAGSGLAHQPNAVLGMMTKELENDFEAQKASNINAQNWLRLTQQHEMNKAQIDKMAAESALIGAQAGAIPSQIAKTEAETGLTKGQTTLIPAQRRRMEAEADLTRGQATAIPSQIARTEAETGLTKAQTGMVPAQIGKIGAETNALNAEAGIKANTLAATRATGGAWQYLVDLTNKLPEGAQKEQAKQALGVLYPQYQGMIADKNAQAAGMINYARLMSGGLGGGEGQPQASVDYQKMNNLVRMGQQKVPGGMTEADTSRATEEAQRVEEARNLKRIYLDAYDKLDSMIAGGQLQPNTRDALINSILPQMAKASAGKFTEYDAKMIDALFPKGTDILNPGAREVKRKLGAEHFEALEKGTPTLDRFKLKQKDVDRPAPKQKETKEEPKKEKKNATGYKEGHTGKTKDGRPIVVRNGEWQLK